MKKIVFLLVFILLSQLTVLAHRHCDSLDVDRIELVPNFGQWADRVLYAARLRGAAFFAEPGSFMITIADPSQLAAFYEAKFNPSHTPITRINASAYRVSLLDADTQCKVVGEQSYSFHHNYFLGRNSSSWVSNVPVYERFSYENLYPGIDLHFYSSDNHLKYDFIVHPFARPSVIRMQYDGLKSISLVRNILLLQTYVAQLCEALPLAYQISPTGDTVIVSCSYQLQDNVVSFKLGQYDESLDLIIDPTLIFSHYSGSTADNWGYTATYDHVGCLYGAGITFGMGYPTTVGAYQMNYCDGSGTMLTDVSISKFSASGDTLLYATYLGGSNLDIPHSLFVNDNEELYVFGTTGSADFPVNALDTVFHGGNSISLSTSLVFANGSDIFVSKFSADGSQLLASTYMGGSGNDGLNTAPPLRKNYADENRGEIVIDGQSNVYVVSSTYSTDFPVTASAYNTQCHGGQDVCVFKMSQDLSQLIWSTLFGGAGHDAGYSLTLASDNSLYFSGGTTSPDLPVNPAAYQSALAGGVDGYAAHLSANGNHLPQCTYLGFQGYDQAYLIKSDRVNCPYLFGQTDASGNAWIYRAQYYKAGGGQFLTKMSPNLDSLVWSTAYGTGNGGPDISPTALMVDYCNEIYMSGWGDRSHQINSFGGTSGLDVTADAFQTVTDGSDFYFICIQDDASQLKYASFFGGSSAHEHVDGGTSRFDRKGCIYQAVCAGCGGNSLFPAYPPNSDTYYNYYNTNHSSNCNLGVLKMNFTSPSVVADFTMPSALCLPDTLHVRNISQSVGTVSTFHWDFGDGTTSSLREPFHVYAHSGYYAVTLVVQDLGSCNFSDTLTKYVLVLSSSTDTLSPLAICKGDFVQVGLPPSSQVTYSWLPDTTLSSLSISNPIATPQSTTTYTLYASAGACVDTIHQRVDVSSLSVQAAPDTLICLGDTAWLWVQPDKTAQIEWSTLSDFSQVFALGQLQISVSPTQMTTYYVRLVYEACVIVRAITVTVKQVHVQEGQEFSICFEPFVQLHIDHDAGANAQYHWELGDGSRYDEENPSVSPTSATTYSVTVTSEEGCEGYSGGIIRVREGTFVEPFDAWCDVCLIMENTTTSVFVTDYGSDYIYHWELSEWTYSPDSSATIVHPPVSTVFTVTVTDTFNCTKTDTVGIVVVPLTCDNPYIYIPNTFSPNHDNLNDVLYVRSELLESFYFAVYSRWGQLVFETTRQDVGWDGTFKGKPCQNGVYDYYFKGVCLDGQEKEITGNVMLVR